MEQNAANEKLSRDLKDLDVEIGRIRDKIVDLEGNSISGMLKKLLENQEGFQKTIGSVEEKLLSLEQKMSCFETRQTSVETTLITLGTLIEKVDHTVTDIYVRQWKNDPIIE